MGTRLLSEHLIKNHFPKIRYVRVHTHGKYAATIYAWNEDLHLLDNEIRSLKQFASEYLQPYVCFKVKSYNMIQDDHVPQVVERELPEVIIKAAMNRGLNQYGITAVINKLFSYGRLAFNSYDSAVGTIHFDFHSIMAVDESDQKLIIHYLQEIIPVGSKCDVNFH
ncbi:hypothetical protein [Paenibacillus sedimenti]|uniref:Uncharacterized protein n=1 Tax=Paenibacillus sedimenti TaxID=2770274 RepID=A0A926QGX4_9BACL|nr:hypothetical protein [Paenibacillus sedimenti]MBD0378895.1 hypothetical protein [Paenibacillus sedimenti]